MSGKNKGGREIRKPKQAKKPKTDEIGTLSKTPGPKKQA